MNLYDPNHDCYMKYPILIDAMNELRLRRYSDRTIVNYMNGIIRFLNYTDKDDPGTLNTNDLREYLFYMIDEQELKPRTVNANNFYVRFLYEAVLDKTINYQKVHLMKIDQAVITFLTKDDVVALLKAVSGDLKFDLAIKLGLCAGLRISEVRSLKMKHVDLSNGFLKIIDSKGRKSRIVPMDATLAKAFRRYISQTPVGEDDYLIHFSSPSFRAPIESVRRWFNKYRDEAGLSDTVTFHSLRHTFATNYMLNDGDLTTLATLMGHRSIKTTYMYLSLAKSLRFEKKSFMDELLGE